MIDQQDDDTGASTSGWAEQWLAGVADGTFQMSQRTLKSVEARGGGLEFVRRAARVMGVHLLLLTDDEGAELVAASRSPFTVIC